MKYKINSVLNFLGHLLIYLSCKIQSAALCAYLIRISILKKKFFSKNKIKSSKIVIVLDRTVGHREIEIIQENSAKAPEFMFLRRSITKLILYYFCNSKKKKIFLIIKGHL